MGVGAGAVTRAQAGDTSEGARRCLEGGAELSVDSGCISGQAGAPDLPAHMASQPFQATTLGLKELCSLLLDLPPGTGSSLRPVPVVVRTPHMAVLRHQGTLLAKGPQMLSLPLSEPAQRAKSCWNLACNSQSPCTGVCVILTQFAKLVQNPY